MLYSLTVWFVNIPHCSALKRFVFHFLNSLLGMTWYWWRWWFLTHVPASVSSRSFILYQMKEMIYMSKWGNASSSMPWDLFESLQTQIRLLWGFLWSPKQSSSCSSVQLSYTLSLSPIHHHLSQYQSSTISISPYSGYSWLSNKVTSVLACPEICLQVFWYKFAC